jgi:hypothetical protein
MTTVQRHQFVTYKVRDLVFRAIVRRVHRDGTATVETRHELRNGEPYGCYMGYRCRISSTELNAE